MVNFEKPANQSDAEKIYRNSISQQYYNIFVGVYANIWNYFISYNISQYGVAALMGNLYDESKMESGVYNIDFHNIIGLTDDEYVNNVNNEIYNNFVNDKVGFGIAQWSSSSSKGKILNECKGNISDLKCQLYIFIQELIFNYSSLNEILKTCIDLKNCTTQFLLLYNNFKNKSKKKQDLKYNYAYNFYNTYSKKCNSSQFFGIRNKKCNNFQKVPNNCYSITISEFLNNSYNICCWDSPLMKCDKNSYSRIHDIDKYECIPLNSNEIIRGCILIQNIMIIIMNLIWNV